MKRLLIWSVVLALFLSCALPPCYAGDPKIQWSHNVFESFQKSCAEKKPLAVLFVAQGTEFSRKLDREVLDEPQMHAFADRAVFVWADASEEDDKGNYKKLKESLGIERYPVLVVLDANEQRLQEVGRVAGYFPREKYLSNFEDLIKTWSTKYAAPQEAPPKAAAALPEGWKTFRSTKGNFELAMPGEPKTVVEDDKVKQYLFASSTPDRTRQVGVQAVEMAEALVRDSSAAEILRSYADVLNHGLQGTISNLKDLEWNGKPSIQFQIQAPNAAKTMTVQSTLVGNRLYLVMTMGPDSNFDKEDFTTLVNTFKVLEAGPAVAGLPAP